MKMLIMLFSLVLSTQAAAQKLTGANIDTRFTMGSASLSVEGECFSHDIVITALGAELGNYRGAFFYQCSNWTYQRLETGEVLQNPACYEPGCTDCTDAPPPARPDDGLWDFSLVVNGCLIHSDCRISDSVQSKPLNGQIRTDASLLCLN